MQVKDIIKDSDVYFITAPKYASFSPCAFLKDKEGRITRLWDASYVDSLVSGDTPCEVVSKEKAIEHAKNMWK